jgi:lipopolysaccharide export system permease protein
MKTLHLYLTRQVLTTLVMTVVVFTFVLLFATAMKELLPLMLNRQASLIALSKAIGLLIPFVMVFALPMGMLTATLLVFGRFSADNELTAVRASGVSLVSLVAPVFLLAIAMSGVTALINMQWAPQCRLGYKEVLSYVRSARPATFIPERTYITDFKDSIVYVRKIRGTNLEDVLIYRLGESNQVVDYVRAERGQLTVDAANNVAHVKLFDGYKVVIKEGKPSTFSAPETEFECPLKPLSSQSRVDITEMTFWQLWDEMRDLEDQMGAPLEMGNPNADVNKRRIRQLRSTRHVDLTSPLRVQAHRQIAFSFSCFAFTMIGIPLGIRGHRRETTWGIAVSIVLVAVYYSFFIVGQALETKHELAPHLILWVPNLIFQAIGAVLLWRANRGV